MTHEEVSQNLGLMLSKLSDDRIRPLGSITVFIEVCKRYENS